jgi:hypothetical protein
MESDNLVSSCRPSPKQHGHRAYVAQAVWRVSPQQAKELLLRNADASDPAVRLMHDRIEEILGRGAPAVNPRSTNLSDRTV